jgi:hypothetical protein
MLICGLAGKLGLAMCPFSMEALGPSSLATTYSFYADWVFKDRRLPLSKRPCTPCTPCSGVAHPSYTAMYTQLGVGMARSSQLHVPSLRSIGMLALHCLLHTKTTGALEVEIRRLNIPALVGQSNCMRSPFCEGNNASASPCSACQDAANTVDPSMCTSRLNNFHVLVSRQQLDAAFFNGHKHSHMTNIELSSKLSVLASGRHVTNQLLQRRTQRLHEVKEQVRKSAATASTRSQVKDLFATIKDANANGTFNEVGQATEVVHTLLNGLAGPQRQARFSQEMKHFYSTLLLHGGPQIHDFVSELLHGPSLSTTRSYLQWGKTGKLYEYGPDRFKLGATILNEMGLQDAPCLLVEDGTALITHFDVVQYKDRVVLFGASKGPLQFASANQAREFITKGEPLRAATMFYLYLLVPLVDGAPAIPVAVLLQDGTKGTYTAESVISYWQQAWVALASEGVCLLGHCGDGAPQFRTASLHHMLRELPKDNDSSFARVGCPTPASNAPGLMDIDEGGVPPRGPGAPKLPIRSPKKYMHFNHALVQLSVGFPNNILPVFVCLDFLHVFFRLRNFLLDAKRTPVVFGMPCSDAKLVTHECIKGSTTPLGIRANDMNATDKQNYEACLRLFGYKRKVTLIAGQRKGIVTMCEDTTILDAFKDEVDYRGLYLFLLFCHRFAKIFLIRTLSPSDILHECGWCLAFIGYWDMSITSSPTATKKKNFLTLETKVDVINILNNIVLGVHAFSILFPNVRFAPWRWSSRYAEFAFQLIRCGSRGNDNRISTLSGLHRVENIQGQIRRSFNSTSFPPLRNKRGMPMYEGRLDDAWALQAHGYYPDEQEQIRAVQRGACELVSLLKQPLEKEGCAGQVYYAWSTLSTPPKVGETFREAPVDFEALSSKHLLTQSKIPLHLWDDTFEVQHSHCVAGLVHENEVANDKAYYHEDLDAFVTCNLACPKHALGSASPLNAMPPCDVDGVFDGDDKLDQCCDSDRGDAPLRVVVANNRAGRARHVIQEFMDTAEVYRCREEDQTSLCEQTLSREVAELGDILVKDEANGRGRRTRDDLRDCADLLRDKARLLNGLYKPKENTRRGDRFIPPALLEQQCYADDTNLIEDEDYIAVALPSTWQGARRSLELRYCMVERCVRTVTKKPQRCHVLRADDPQGLLTVRFFEAHTRDASRRLRLSLPVVSERGYNAQVKCTDVVGSVRLFIPAVKDVNGKNMLDSLGNVILDDFWRISLVDERFIKEEFNAFDRGSGEEEPLKKVARTARANDVAAIEHVSKVKQMARSAPRQKVPTKLTCDIVFCFAPLKQPRKYKAVAVCKEGALVSVMGVSVITAGSTGALAELDLMVVKLDVEQKGGFQGWGLEPAPVGKWQARRYWIV